MADATEDDTLDLTEDQQIDDQAPADQDDQTDTPEGGDGEEETIIGFGEDIEAAPASGESETSLVKHLRAELRKRDKALADALKGAVQPQTIEVGPKPTLAECDYDEDAFEAKLTEWHSRKAEADRAKSEAERQAEQANEVWAKRVQAYEQGREALPYPDKDDAKDTVEAVLGIDRRKVIVRVADNPAALEYALGKAPAKLKALSEITDPVDLIKAVVKLEAEVKTVTRKKAPAPDTPTRGSASVRATTADKELERLRERAYASGNRADMDKYLSAKRSAKPKG